MKNIFPVLFFIFTVNVAIAQKSYIQVNGEPNLSVFLDNQYKGKTTAEYNGYIIENVSPGSHVIKIVKEKYTPYEETITVKAGEVFAYKVKPFTKHSVTITESGNSGATEKKAEVRTGKLIVQSVPIEIKITIPAIEGVTNAPKTKDEWAVSDIPEGSYPIALTFGGKTINQQITIIGGEVTNVFANMISGEFNVKSTLDAKRELARQEKYVYDLMERHGMKRGLSLSAFFSYNKDAERIAKYADKLGNCYLPEKVALKDLSFTPGPRHVYSHGEPRTVWSYTYALKRFDNFNEASTLMKELATTFQQNVPSASVWGQLGPSEMKYLSYFNKRRVYISYEVKTLDKNAYELRISMSAD